MIAAILVSFVDLFSLVFTGLLLVRVVLSWVYPHPDTNAFSRVIYELTEPLLAPLRQVLPPMGFIDLAPLAAFFLLQGLVWLTHYFLLR